MEERSSVRQISSIEDPLVAVVNEGTGCVRFVVYSTKRKEEIASYEKDLAMCCPQEGWAEQDPLDILAAVKECVNSVMRTLSQEQLSSIVTLGITNQRETTLVWDRITGEPLYNAILWSDIRTDSTVDSILAKLPENSKDSLKPLCGLPVSPYFSALKLRWLLDNVPAVRQAVLKRRCYFGTVDSWIVWNLTGGVDGGIHITDVTNASRTMLMNIDTLKWDMTLCKHFGIPLDMLPEIRSCSEIYGTVRGGPLAGKPISGMMGNQHSALVGQGCLKEGQAKNTYRSGCFLIYNTGHSRVNSSHGLVTTVCYQLGKNSKPVYGLEGSVAIAGTAVKWLRDNLGLLSDVSETESLAQEVMTTGDVYFVPAFNGLFAPYWRKDARGILCGLTQFTTKGHIIRAALEAVCFQTRDILEAMHKDCGVPLSLLKVDGKMTSNRLLMQLQADLCGIPVVRTGSCDITSYGVALAAGWAKGIEVWDTSASAVYNDIHATTFTPSTSPEDRNHRYTKWKMAVKRSLGWAKGKRNNMPMPDERYRLLASIPGTIFVFSSFVLLVLAKNN